MSRKFLGRSGADFALGIVVGVIIALLVVTTIFTDLGDMLWEGAGDVMETGERRAEDIVEERTKYPILQWQNIHPRDRAGDPPDDAIEIEDCDGLQDIKNDPDGDYVLVDDINCHETKEWNEGKGFDAIGEDENEFTGMFDGQGYIISGLYINRPSKDFAGLFGTTSDAVIKNIGVEGVNITGKDRVGGLIGGSYGNSVIYNSYATGAVEGNELVGGLAGSSRGDILNSYTKVDVKGSKYVGGLGGFTSGDITRSYSTASVEGDRQVGGLIGEHWYGDVSNCYANGPVRGNEDGVGGLIGVIWAGATISNCYSNGLVDVPGEIGIDRGLGDSFGGLISYWSGETPVTNSFWNVDTANMDGNPYLTTGTPKKTEAMESKITYTDTRTAGLEDPWDFEHTWTFYSGRNFTDVELNTLKIDIDNPEGGYVSPGPGIIYMPEGEKITLKADPHEGWNFDGWTGDYESGNKEITLTIDEDKEVTAQFSLAELEIIVVGEGTTDPVEGTHEYEYGEEVTVEANPKDEWQFVKWTGDVTSDEEKITITMDSDKEIIAHFEGIPVELNCESKEITKEDQSGYESITSPACDDDEFLLTGDCYETGDEGYGGALLQAGRMEGGGGDAWFCRWRDLDDTDITATAICCEIEEN